MVYDFFVDLSRMAELADNQDQIREATLRQEFIRGISHTHIAAILRERPDLDMDQLLD